MAVLDLAVSRLVVVILHLGVLLVLVRIATSAENLKFGQKREIIDRCCDVSSDIGAVTHAVRVLGNGLHHRTQVGGQRSHQSVRHRAGSRVGRGVVSNNGGCLLCAVPARCLVRRTKDVVTHIASLPAAIVGVVVAGGAPVVHLEILRAIVALVATIVAVNQAHIGSVGQRRLERTEVDTGALLGTVVVEAQDVDIQCSVDSQRSHSAFYQDALPVANIPILAALASVGDLPDFSPGLVIQRLLGWHKLGGHSHSLIGRSGMIGASRHLDGDSSGASSLVDVLDGHSCTRDRHGCHADIAGSSGNSAVAGACNGHCLCQIGCVQRYRACAQGHATSGLADAPGHGLVRGRAIRPHIISFGSEGSVVAGGIGASGRTAQGELCAVVVAPGRSLRVTVVGQRTTLSGDV